MKHIIKHPYGYFFSSAVIIFLIGTSYITRYSFLYKYDEIIINIYDTYYVISHFEFSKIAASVLLLIGFIYLYLYTWDFALNKFMVKAHTILSLGCFLIFYFGWFYFEITNANKFPLFDDQTKENILNITLIGSFVFAQVIFILNLIFSVIQKLKS